MEKIKSYFSFQPLKKTWEMITLDEQFFKELHEMKHEDEMRSKVLLYGIKRILAEKKEESLIHKLFKSKKRTLAERWN